MRQQQHPVDSVAHLVLPDREIKVRRSAHQSQQGAFAHPPLFLHCGWRTRGTWVWDRFRKLDGVAGYYEPLAEALARVRPRTLASINAESWPSGHAGLDRPYFDAFRPLLKRYGMGVQGYQTRFATDDFFASPDTALPELAQYLRLLLSVAEERGEQPVLKLCRSIGRIGWMQRHFPDAVHIVVLRNPVAQFASALRQFTLYGNAYFLAMPLLLLAIHRDLPPVSACVRHLGAELPFLLGCHTLEAKLTASETWVRCSSLAGWYRGFLAFWVLTAGITPDNVDMVIDSELLDRSSHYRRQCEIELATLTGQAVDFSDASGSEDASKPEACATSRSDFLLAHRRAETFLTEEVDAHWADTPTLGHVGRMLAEASLRVAGAEVVRQTPDRKKIVLHDTEQDCEAMLLSAMGRAAWAERELGAMRASRSWRVTAPLRWLCERLR